MSSVGRFRDLLALGTDVFATLRNSFLGHGHLETKLDKVVAISGKIATNRTKSQYVFRRRVCSIYFWVIYFR